MDIWFLVMNIVMKKVFILWFLLMLHVPTMWANCIVVNEWKPIFSWHIPDKKTEIEANMRQARHFMEKEDYVDTDGWGCSRTIETNIIDYKYIEK